MRIRPYIEEKVLKYDENEDKEGAEKKGRDTSKMHVNV